MKNLSINEILYATVGIVRGTAYAEVFKNWFPNHAYTVEYDTPALAFAALARGEIELYMASKAKLQMLTHYNELVEYKANVVFERPCHSTFGFNKDEAVLCSIMDKALRLIDTDGISVHWTQKTYDYRAKVAEAQRPWLIGAVSMSLIILALLLFMYYRSRNEERRLAKLVAEQTSTLVTATEEAKIASESKSLFLANMSHEIRTPMNSIMGFAELALDGDVPVKTKDYLEKIMKNTTWLLQIINDVLDISKIEAGRMELENIPFDVHELFTSCRTLILPKAVEKGLLLHFYTEPSIGRKPMGDPTRLRQVLLNLLSNAIKFTNTGMIKISSVIKNASGKTVTISFLVTDSGIGMTSEQISRIFDPFVQADGTTTRKFGGTGLGLSITKNIVELMGGKLVVESKPMVGSKFSFDLTFDTIDVLDDKQIEQEILLDTMERPVFEGEILLCEDNVMNQQMICEHLARVGLKTVVAENGKIGVDMVENRIRKCEKQFDLIFMDIHMPVMDGLEAASKIFGMYAGIPTVALTANVMSNDIEVYKKSGMSDCVGKPFTSQELWRCLMKYFKPVSWQTVNETQYTQAESSLRQKLVTNFVKSNQNKTSEIKDALGRNDMELALRLAHTLKGNAAQLGKVLLQNAAAEIEHQLKEGKPVTPQQMSALETEFSAALTELTVQFEQFSRLEEASPASPPDPETVQGLFNKLEPMLDSGDPESLKLIDTLRSVPGSEKLIEQMENLDFHAAMETLISIREK